MNLEQLELHKKLQPLYDKMMVKWFANDVGYFVKEKKLAFCTGYWTEEGGRKIYSFSFGIETIPTRSVMPIRIPYTVSPHDDYPERGLWGMLDWKKYHSDTYQNGSVIISKRPKNEFDFDALAIRFKGDLTTTLLKALCNQEGI